jgi:hypothetical protein
MTLPTFRLNGIEAIDGFEGVDLKSCSGNSVTCEISGSPDFIRHASSQLLLGSTTATIDEKLVHLNGAVRCMTELDPTSASFSSQYGLIP